MSGKCRSFCLGLSLLRRTATYLRIVGLIGNDGLNTVSNGSTCRRYDIKFTKLWQYNSDLINKYICVFSFSKRCHSVAKIFFNRLCWLNVEFCCPPAGHVLCQVINLPCWFGFRVGVIFTRKMCLCSDFNNKVNKYFDLYRPEYPSRLHITVATKWSPFRRWHFHNHFLGLKIILLYSNFIKMCSPRVPYEQ